MRPQVGQRGGIPEHLHGDSLFGEERSLCYAVFVKEKNTGNEQLAKRKGSFLLTVLEGLALLLWAYMVRCHLYTEYIEEPNS